MNFIYNNITHLIFQFIVSQIGHIFHKVKIEAELEHILQAHPSPKLVNINEA